MIKARLIAAWILAITVSAIPAICAFLFKRNIVLTFDYTAESFAKCQLLCFVAFPAFYVMLSFLAPPDKDRFLRFALMTPFMLAPLALLNPWCFSPDDMPFYPHCMYFYPDLSEDLGGWPVKLCSYLSVGLPLCFLWGFSLFKRIPSLLLALIFLQFLCAAYVLCAYDIHLIKGLDAISSSLYLNYYLGAVFRGTAAIWMVWMGLYVWRLAVRNCVPVADEREPAE